MIFEHNFLGRSGFYWFFGVVEDRMDPLKIGRVRVRCHGWHTEIKAEIPTSQLIWATVSQPTTSSATSGVGENPYLVEGTWVWGFFLDGIEAQRPMVCGSVAGIPQDVAQAAFGFADPRKEFSTTPANASVDVQDGVGATVTNVDRGAYPQVANIDEPDTPRLARNDDGLIPDQVTKKTASRVAGQVGIPTATDGTFDEPEVPFDAEYPYNHARVTESGHAFEMDDTRNHERVHVFHRSGSFIEFHPNGTVVEKSVRDGYRIIHRDDYMHVEGKQVVTIDKGIEVLVNKDAGSNNYTIKLGAGGNFNITVVQGNVNLTLQNGNLNENITGNISRTVSGSVTEHITGGYTRTVGQNVSDTVTGGYTRSVGQNLSDTITGSITRSAASETANISGALQVTAGSVTVQASTTSITSTVTVNGTSTFNGNVTVNGNENVSGNVIASGDVRAGGGSVGLLTHTHTFTDSNSDAGTTLVGVG